MGFYKHTDVDSSSTCTYTGPGVGGGPLRAEAPQPPSRVSRVLFWSSVVGLGLVFGAVIVLVGIALI